MSNTKPDVAENLKKLGCLIAIICFAAVVAGFFAPLHSPRHRVEDLLQKGNTTFEAQKFESAVQYYTRAAELGNAEAQYKLGCCYETGTGVEKDLNEAEYWFRKSAEQGEEQAQAALKRLGAQ